MFVNIKEVGKTYFSSCDNCIKDCCSAPMVTLAPLVIDDFEYVYKRFLIQFAFINDELKVLMVINRGKGSCIYYENKKCIIYDERPPACKMYPISPYFDEFYISSDCSALSSNENFGELIRDTKNVNDEFLHPRVNNFVKKLESTKKFLEKIEKDLISSIKVTGIQLFNYGGKNR
ncbi:YkgJ family cysteine cluster protein [Arcobacter lacus]|uniref:YkgJ family cysteine cluster protein n=1 Tax=Arcobacter lacus TaxID=1912876 RepID=A0ABX5JF56_9BACT|nr:YkgJ family cysteine cluster protein [Arcobacter lacus]PUE64837.1 hypothetical protein B0175_10545 [Arcobacter lacus]